MSTGVCTSRKPRSRQMAADHLGQAGPGGQPFDQGSSAQVQVAIAQPGLLADLAVALDRKGQHLGRRQHLGVATTTSISPVASLALTVSAGRATTSPVTLITLSTRRWVRVSKAAWSGWATSCTSPPGSDPAGVAQVQEQQAAVIALGRHPARQADRPPDVVEAQGSAPGVAVLG